MEEFNLSLPEVRNKIRIFRTTYNQEKKKEDTIINYKPKLSWYKDMKLAFETGKIKSFQKTPGKIKVELVKEKESTIHYEYENENDEMTQEEDERQHNAQQIIIEPYDEYEIDEDDQEIEVMKKDEQHNTSQSNQTLLSSNELFLNSLKSSLDKLSDEKNMRARISIQEVLYKIMYEK
jgi:hypothetical protein